MKTLLFFQEKEREGQPFSAEEFAEASGYPLGPSLRAKLNRQEFGEFLTDLGDGTYSVLGTLGMAPKEYAWKVSSEYRRTHAAANEQLNAQGLSGRLVVKSLHAALSAIEVYNKPDFKYREEAFSILMVNAWELLLKAKVVRDNGEDDTSIHQKTKEGAPIPSRSGNPKTITIGEAMDRVDLDQVLADNLFALIEIRDNAIHLLNDGHLLNVKMLEVGTASLRSYLTISQEWFSLDLSRYNFYLMPMSFFHPHELTSYSINQAPAQHQGLLRYIASLEEKHAADGDQPHSITLQLKTEFVKSKMRIDPNDPGAISVKVDEEKVFQQKYPWSYKDHLLPALAKRYSDFKVDKKFLRLKKEIEADVKYSKERPLDWNKPKPTKRFYNPNIMVEFFDKHYMKK
ncbi:MAG: DUF3644 domain-containing protein [Flavobacteriales bacterium]|nr:DUF3644 domain-containing protein [Flavobacteriales bacterium]